MNFENAIAQACYDTSATIYANSNVNSIFNACYERPAMLSLLPEVEGKNILDAGCGPGNLAQQLVQQGASVRA